MLKKPLMYYALMGLYSTVAVWSVFAFQLMNDVIQRRIVKIAHAFCPRSAPLQSWSSLCRKVLIPLLLVRSQVQNAMALKTIVAAFRKKRIKHRLLQASYLRCCYIGNIT
jgi:hypothetical protein